MQVLTLILLGSHIGSLAEAFLPARSSSIKPFQRTLEHNRALTHLSTASVSVSVSEGDEIIENENSAPKRQIDYDWKKVWYPITYSDHILDPSKSAEPIAASIFDNPIVLWRDGTGTLLCADDKCPHRAAALSEGQIYDGKLECLYHGWQFQGNQGECVTIPQLVEGASIPKNACLRMRTVQESEGVVWVWMGDEEPDSSDPATAMPPLSGNDLDKHSKKYSIYDIQMDLPYDHSYLIENLLDPAHIPISHDATSGGGKRENAQGFNMEVDENSFSSKGFTGRYSMTKPKKSPASVTEVMFDAPGIIRNRTKNGKIEFNADLHCTPLGIGRSRLLFRVYFTGLPKLAIFLVNAKPKWLRNLNSCKILEQDLGLITTQEDHFARTGRNLKDDFILIKSSDAHLGAYRRWLDRVGHGMPWYVGLVSSTVAKKNVELNPGLDPIGHRSGGLLETRYHRHVMHSPKTRNALRRIKAAKRASLAVAVAAFSVSLNLSGVNKLQGLVKPLTLLAPTSALLSSALYFLEKEFYVSYNRRLEVRDKRGVQSK